ncbi:restriction endonuclease subunit S [Acinetobacter sp. VNK23]|uniref:restriction endonuclease subunit S n=1 Tax=Acinetobacter thutiue TaxID=2998078 RepID=UPI0025769BAE|nr:restriction endonuclease subunit S [Acinetobacter thutiue]MDM1020831.1 restriction endonuclease subunit S [Acinetobacter thutiue]
MAAPKLRFKEFDGDWSAQKYKDALTIKYGKDHKLLEDGEIPVYGTGGVMRYVNQYLYDGESILIGRKGTIDQPKYVNEKFWTVDTLFYSEIKQNIYPLFIYQHALQVNWLGLNEATGVPSLNTTSINNVDIYLPSKEEQTKIASFLSNVDEKISQLNQKHELLSQYKQGMMQKLFSQQIRFKADDGSEFGEWEEKIIGEIANIKRGASPRPITDTKWFDEDSKVGWVRISDVSKSKKVLVETEQYLSNAGIKKSRFIPKGNIIMSICATIGKPIYTGFDVCIHDGFVVFSELKAWHEYTYYYLEYIEKNWYQYGQPGTQVNLNSDIVSNEIFPFPCLEEQTKIANFLSSIDQKIEVVAQQIEQAKQWKKGLLQQMFV